MFEALKIDVVIPAAGASSRMGKPKALLPAKNKSIIENQVDTLKEAGLSRIFVVTNRGEHYAERLKGYDVQIIPLIQETRFMIESVRVGMQQFNAVSDGMMVLPSDFPYLTKELLVCLLSAFNIKPEKITVPAYHEKRGHPVIIPSFFFEAVQNRFDDCGIRGLYTAFPDSINEVEWRDGSVLKNMNTQEDYAAYLDWLQRIEK